MRLSVGGTTSKLLPGLLQNLQRMRVEVPAKHLPLVVEHIFLILPVVPRLLGSGAVSFLFLG